MYCRSEICIAAPTYILPLRNMLSRRHVHVRKPSLYSELWAPSHERVYNGLVPAPRPPTCSPIAQRPAVCPHRVPPSARNLPHGAHGRLSWHHVTAT